MKNYKINQLEELLNEWFNETDLAARNVFNQNKVAKLIKTKLDNLGHWKSKPRGKVNKNNLNKPKSKEVNMSKSIKVLPGGKTIYSGEGDVF